MALWQKRVRFVILILGIAFAIVVALAVRRRDAVGIAPLITRTDPTALIESTGTIVIEAKGSTPEFRIEGGRYLSYPDGHIRVLDGAKVKVENRAGRSFVVTAREGEVSSDRSQVQVKGDVRMTSSDGFTATANDASYAKAEGIIRTDGPASFTHKNISGSGTGMTYDEPRDVVWILNNAEVTIAEDEKGHEAVKVHAGAAGLARQDKYLKFIGGVTAESASRRIGADESTAFLSDDGKRIQMVELRGHSGVETTESGGGGLRNMHARDMNLTYGPDGRTLQRATLAGTSVVEIAGEASGQERRLSAEWIEMGLAANGRTVSTLTSREHVEFTMPGSRTSASRTIRAGSFEAAGDGDGGGGLDHARFLEGIEFRETPAGSTQSRLVKARDLHVRFKAGLVALEEARFMGDVTLEDGDTTATGAEARYLLARSTMILVGRPDQLPHVATADGSVDAERFELLVDNRRVISRIKVKSIVLPIAEAKAAGGRETKRPHIMKADQAINGMADHLDSDEKAGRALYSGNARVWQIDTSIQADRITMDDRTGDLSASGNVRSTLMLEQTNPQTTRKPKAGVTPPPIEEKPADEPAAEEKKTTKMATIAASRELQYEDKSRKVTYRNDAHVVGAQGDLKADRIELYLSEDGERLERAEAYGHVTLRDETRVATSQRLSYFVADERYDLGGDVRVVEQCRETTGRTLTFFKSTDTISVDGKLEVRTQTRSSNSPKTPSGNTNTITNTIANSKCSGATPR
ncbi:MAG: LPS export ABC transporter periplasmic protein LptC [Acidobacteria bacterium]|nr:LPS export ABC transporter periplasmic protein LptC [Acidobacteriota bacterium]MBI3264936.1 LPS export ABC transporter periplasmic protein LptC [Acidobacteriota bacterium]